MTKIMPLADAVRMNVSRGVHLHFASTPSRSNAGIREVARQYRGRNPGFTLSATGFHSTAHLLAMLRLGKRYVSCFFGDNYPVPRPNPLYTSILDEGAHLEHWSLLSYVSALRAGAMGDPYAIVRSLVGTTLGDELAAQGKLTYVPDPEDPSSTLAMVRAMRPDVAFVHAAAADARGRVVCSAPYGEGFWGALAARRGVIVTVDRIVDSIDVARVPDALHLPPHRVLAVCHEPYGGHPQPMHATPSVEREAGAGYGDDFDHYELWAAMAAAKTPTAKASFERFTSQVLLAKDGAEGYRRFVGEERLASSSAIPAARATSGVFSTREDEAHEGPVSESDRLAILAARRIVARVLARHYRVILAGLGQSFLACRLAKRMLDELAVPIEINVETGLLDVDCGEGANDFLLARDNVAAAGRLSSVEVALGALTCGADNRCLGVIGAAQVDAGGNVNSTRLEGGRLLVGSGGANDIASSAAEVIVVTSCSPRRLVARADYVTSPGTRVLEVVTEACTFRRAVGIRDAWHVAEPYAEPSEADVKAALARVKAACPWDLRAEGDVAFARRVTPHELHLLRALRGPKPARDRASNE